MFKQPYVRAVITGGPSVGKTTIIQLLAAHGFRVVEEFATQIIKEGKVLPWVDRRVFQTEVLRRQLAAEAALIKYEQPVFLDRGLFDGEAYYLYDKIDVPGIFKSLDASHYSVAFLIEPLPFFEQTDVRRESLHFTKEISAVLETCYTSRNVKVVRVPAMPPEPRVRYVLQEFDRLGVSAQHRPSRAERPIVLPAKSKSLTAVTAAAG